MAAQQCYHDKNFDNINILSITVMRILFIYLFSY